MELVLIRHGESTGNVGNCISSPDDPLTERGVQQARVLGRRLAAEGWAPKRLVCSPFVRARQTAEIVAECLAVPSYDVHDDLAEMSVGAFGGMVWQEFLRRYPELNPDGASGWSMSWSFPGGESLAEVRERGAAALQRLAAFAGEDDRPVIAISHGTLLNQALCGFMGVPPSPHTRFSWRNTAIAVLSLANGLPAKLIRLNDIHHLEELPKE